MSDDSGTDFSHLSLSFQIIYHKVFITEIVDHHACESVEIREDSIFDVF